MDSTLEAYIQWKIVDSDGNELASSYEHINGADEAADWASNMESYELGENDEDEDD